MNEEKLYTPPDLEAEGAEDTPEERTALMLGADAVERLKGAKVMIIGIGGVGGHALEAIVRAGVGTVAVVDGDKVAKSNLNRQLLATVKTIGMAKTEAARERVADIAPGCRLITHDLFVTPENVSTLNLAEYDYVIDAIDTVTSKIAIIKEAKRCGVPIISSMGTGNKLDPTRFRISDIEKTNTDPLARAVRGLLKKEGIKKVKVLWSDEPPISVGKRTPGSVSFVPSVAGIIIASCVIKDLIGRS